MFEDVACIILAGGRATRLGGVEKGLVPVAGRRLLDHVLARVRGHFPTTLVVTSRSDAYREFGLPCVPDRLTQGSSITGLHAGLCEVRELWALAIACDMPAVSVSLVERLAAERADADVVMPVHSEGEEPLHALYAKSCVPIIERFAARGEWKMTAFHAEARVRRVRVAPLEFAWRGVSPFVNLNTPEEVEGFGRVRGEIRQV
ncbi:MAG: molybdenum cofactor guanylyltransferase [Planctomycetes bacterium]|nr:molybdenum cofactor guanylyltransferase [Planctomycetota bacterium]